VIISSFCSRNVGSPEKARRLLGWSPQATSEEALVRLFLADFRPDDFSHYESAAT
jgi:nucleoside-diphosphate-sugar epimerase